MVSQYRLINAHLQNIKAKIAERNGDYGKAEKLLNPLKPILSTSDSYWQNYANLFLSQNRYTEAIIMLDHQKSLSSNPEAYIQEGYCFVGLKRYPEAEREFLVANFIQPNRLAPKYALMNLYLDNKDTVKAILSAYEILRIKPKRSFDTDTKYRMEASAVISKLIHVQ